MTMTRLWVPTVVSRSQRNATRSAFVLHFHNDTHERCSPIAEDEDTEESAEEEGDYGSMEMSVTALSKPKKKVYEVDFEVLSSSDIDKTMAKEADLLCSMLGVEVSFCIVHAAGTRGVVV